LPLPALAILLPGEVQREIAIEDVVDSSIFRVLLREGG